MRLRGPLGGAVVAALLTAMAVRPDLGSAQSATGERVTFRNASDGTALVARLALPSDAGPHPGVVLVSVAGHDPVVEGLVDAGYAVLAPELRGFVQVEPLLRATFDDLAGDLAAALAHLGAHPAVDSGALALVAQADNTPPAILHAAAAEPPVPLVLLAPPAFPGVETFRLEQRWIATNQGVRADALGELDGYVRGIGEIVLDGRTPRERMVRLEGLRARSRVGLPRNAAFPFGEGQSHFLSSPLWRDKLAFEPGHQLARLRSSVLVLIGTDDPNTPMDDYLSAVRGGLAAADTEDATVCRIPRRTRHVFSPAAVDAIVGWLDARLGSDAPGPGAPPGGCLPDDEG